MSRKVMMRPPRHAWRKVLVVLGFLALLAWAVHTVTHGLSVFFSGLGR